MNDAEEEAEPGLAAIAEALESAEEISARPLGPISKTPPDIEPLGHLEGSYHFITRDGEQRDLTAREMIRLNLSSLFGGETFWLCENFPCFNKRGEKIPDAFNANNAAEWLMRQCSLAGLFSKDTPARGLGVWRSGNDVVAHLGREIWHRGQRHRSGRRIGGAIYVARPSTPEPDFGAPATRLDAQSVRSNMNAWSFTQEHDADLLFGFIGAALLGGFPQWRAHALVTGERGSGKSTLGEYIMRVIGGQGLTLNDYSDAGIRQTLTNEARTLWLDEGESAGEEQAHRMAKVIGLLRKMSGGDGARIARGTSGGTALNATVTGCVLLTAINPPSLQPQDKSRILTVPLAKPSELRSAEDMRAFLREAAGLSRKLRARAILAARRFTATSDLYRGCLIRHGCDARQADLFATLLAGRSALLDDAMPTEEEAERYVALLGRRLHLIMVDDSDASDGQSCLNRLLDSECAAVRDGLRRSIGQIVAAGIEPPCGAENEKLVPLGLRIVDLKGESPPGSRALFVANDHFGLRRIFHNTAWADGNWRSSLARLKGVRPSPAPISVGRKSRGLLIPACLLPSREDATDVDCAGAARPDLDGDVYD